MENPHQLDKFMQFHPCCINFLLEWTRNDQEWLTHSQFTTFTATCKATLVCIRGDHGTNTSVSESSHNHRPQKKTKGSTGQLFRQPFANLSNFCVLDCFALCDRCQFHPIYIYIQFLGPQSCHYDCQAMIQSLWARAKRASEGQAECHT